MQDEKQQRQFRLTLKVNQVDHHCKDPLHIRRDRLRDILVEGFQRMQTTYGVQSQIVLVGEDQIVVEYECPTKKQYTGEEFKNVVLNPAHTQLSFQLSTTILAVPARQNRHSSLVDLLTTAQTELATTRDALNEKQQQLADARTEAGLYKEEADRLRMSVDPQTLFLLQQYRTLGTPEELQARLAQLAPLTERNSALEVQVRSLTVDLAQVASNCELRLQEAAAAALLGEEAIERYRKSTEQIKGLERDLRAAQQEGRTLRLQLRDLSRLQGLEGAYRELLGKYDDAQRLNAQLVGKTQELRRDAQSATAQVGEYQAKVAAKDAELTALRQKNEQVTAQAAEQSKRIFESPFEELSVLLARRLGGIAYERAVAVYDEVFPEGMDAEMRVALAQDKSEFVLNDAARASPGIQRFASDLESPLEALIEKVSATIIPFEETPAYQDGFFTYDGACRGLQAGSLSQPLRQRAETIKADFEARRSQHEAETHAATELKDLLLARSKAYDAYTTLARRKPLDFEVPLICFTRQTHGQYELSLMLPLTEQTADARFTHEAVYDLAFALRESLTANADAACSSAKHLGSEVYTVTIPKSDASPNQRFLLALQRNLNSQTLSQLGVKWKIFNLGEVSNG